MEIGCRSINNIGCSERTVLRFGSATHQAKVYVNGNLAVEHKGGFPPFETELNPFLVAGKNRLTVALNNIVDYSTLPVGIYSEKELPGIGKKVTNQPNFDFFNYAGLQRPVKIYTTPHIYIQDVEIVTDLEGLNGKVKYAVKIVNEAEVKITVLDEVGEIVAEDTGQSGTITLENVKLWQPLNAYLYTLKIELVQDGKMVEVDGG